MHERKRRIDLAAVGVATMLVAGTAVMASAVPTNGGAPDPGFESDPGLLAQNFGGPGAFGQGPGFGQGSGFGNGVGQGNRGNGLTQGFQGGGVGGGLFSLEAGQTAQQLAFCTDLLSDPPDETTAFTGGGPSQVAFADGRVMTLASAIDSGLVAVRGAAQPIRLLGVSDLALRLAFTDRTPAPLRIRFTPGTTFTPVGQAAQPLPSGGDRLFALAAEKGLDVSNTLQYAVWAARGSTAEDVEQANLTRLPAAEIDRVQELLDQSGIHQDFDRNRGLAAIQYEDAVARLGDAAEKIHGSTTLADGRRATVEGVRAPDGTSFVTVRPARGGEFFFASQVEARGDGRLRVKLAHLTNGRALVGNGATLTVAVRTAEAGTG